MLFWSLGPSLPSSLQSLNKYLRSGNGTYVIGHVSNIDAKSYISRSIDVIDFKIASQFGAFGHFFTLKLQLIRHTFPVIPVFEMTLSVGFYL